MQVVNQARCQRCGRAMERVAEIAPFGSEPGLVAFPCSDCGSTASALVWLAMANLGYAPQSSRLTSLLPSYRSLRR